MSSIILLAAFGALVWLSMELLGMGYALLSLCVFIAAIAVFFWGIEDLGETVIAATRLVARRIRR